MSFRRNLLTLALVTSSLLSGCVTQRPFYRDIMQPEGASIAAGTPVELVVLDADTNQPVKGAKVLWGEDYRWRESYVTDDDGRVAFDVSRSLLKENPLVEIVLPAGVRAYRLQLVPPGGAIDGEDSEAPEAAEAPEAPEAPAAPETPATEAPAPAPETAPGN